MKPYLYALEVHDMNVGQRYDMLPVHCTLVHWFELEAEREQAMRDRVRGFVSKMAAIPLTA